MKASRKLEVYGLGRRLATRSYFSCEKRTGFTRMLNDGDAQTVYAPETLVIRGRFVAFFTTQVGRDGGTAGLELVDATRRARAIGVPAYTDALTPHATLGRVFPGIVLSGAGDLAWIAQRGYDDPAKEVFYAPRGGEARLLDASPEVVADSLAVNDRFVYWHRTDGPRSAERPR